MKKAQPGGAAPCIEVLEISDHLGRAVRVLPCGRVLLLQERVGTGTACLMENGRCDLAQEPALLGRVVSEAHDALAALAHVALQEHVLDVAEVAERIADGARRAVECRSFQCCGGKRHCLVRELVGAVVDATPLGVDVIAKRLGCVANEYSTRGIAGVFTAGNHGHSNAFRLWWAEHTASDEHHTPKKVPHKIVRVS